jgi:ATP-dependent Clp protease, protease subunit
MNKFCKAFISVLITTISLNSHISYALADYTINGPIEGKEPNSIIEAKIYYTGEVNEKKALSLIEAIDDANLKYPNLKHIYLYIDSYGGDMDSGYSAYQAISSSRTPITTVNLATVMSSATMMFCAGKERVSLKGGRFILHPAASNINITSAQPQDMWRIEQNVNTLNRFFFDTYKECTSMKESEINHILQSEYQRAFWFADDAKKNNMISGVVDKIMDTPVSYYINDSQ